MAIVSSQKKATERSTLEIKATEGPGDFNCLWDHLPFDDGE